MSYERLVVAGNIGSVEVLTSKQGNDYIRMSLAVDRISGAAKFTTWYSVLLFGAMARDPARIKALYTPGRLILAEGRPQVEAYVRKDGTAGLDNTIIAISVPELFDTRPKGSGVPG